jgi:hypothetical protein
MKKFFKRVFYLLLALTLLAGLVVLLRNELVRSYLERTWAQQTGFETVVGEVSISLRSPAVTIRNVRLLNPESLGGRPFVDAPEIQVEYDAHLLFSRELQLRLRRVSLELEEVYLMRKAKGQSTQQILVDRIRRQQEPEASRRGWVSFGGIERLSLSLKHYAYVDHFQLSNSQDLALALEDYTGTNLVSLKHFSDFYVRLGRDHRLHPLPVEAPSPGETNSTSRSAGRR